MEEEVEEEEEEEEKEEKEDDDDDEAECHSYTIRMTYEETERSLRLHLSSIAKLTSCDDSHNMTICGSHLPSVTHLNFPLPKSATLQCILGQGQEAEQSGESPDLLALKLVKTPSENRALRLRNFQGTFTSTNGDKMPFGKGKGDGRNGQQSGNNCSSHL
ncbi:hypothetical protein STEG23_030209 [Scotinomys teguina]